MTTDARPVIGLDFFPPLSAMTLCYAGSHGKIDFHAIEVPEPRSGEKRKAIVRSMREHLLPHVCDGLTIVIGQSYFGIGSEEAMDEIVDGCPDTSTTLLVRHHRLVQHFGGLHSMSRNDFIMEHMTKSKGSRFGEVYSEMLRRYGVDQQRRNLRAVS